MENLTPHEAGWIESLAELRDSPSIRTRKCYHGDMDLVIGDASAAFDALENWEHISLDPALQTHFLRFSEVSAFWETVEPRPTLSGEFNLSHFYEVFYKKAPEHLITSHDTEERRRLISEFRVFDDTPLSGVGSFTALRIQSNVSDPEVWHYKIPWGPMRMDIDYRGYLDTLRLTKGTFDWQYLFIETSLASEELEATAYRLKTMLQIFPEIFPGHDYGPLQERLMERLR